MCIFKDMTRMYSQRRMSFKRRMLYDENEISVRGSIAEWLIQTTSQKKEGIRRHVSVQERREDC
jgi:hypothetical protein